MKRVRWEATIRRTHGLKRWQVTVQDWRDFGSGRMSVNPLVSERMGWECWTERGAHRLDKRLVARRERRDRANGWQVEPSTDA